MNTGTCYLVRYRYLVPGTWYTVYCNTRYEYKYLLNLPAKPNDCYTVRARDKFVPARAVFILLI